MSDTVERDFETPGPIELLVELAKGSVRIHLAEVSATRVQVEGRNATDVEIEQRGDEVHVIGPKSPLGLRPGSLSVVVTAPTGSAVVVRTGSADLLVDGVAGAVTVKTGSGDVRVAALTGASVVQTGSGDVRIEDARADLKIKSGSGDVVLGRAAADLAISTGSGDAVVEAALGRVVAKTGSGDLRLHETHDDVSLASGSGDLVIAKALRGRLSAKDASGSVRIGIPPTVPVWTDLTTVKGQIRSDLPGAGEPEEGADYVELRATTVSGDIVLVPA